MGAGTMTQEATVPTIETAERLLSDFENVLIQLSGKDRADLGVELARLMDVAGAADPHGASAELPRCMGRNRASMQPDD
jgi:hypothetical protein